MAEGKLSSTMRGRVYGLVLAGGLSERMGAIKLLLPLGGRTVLDLALQNLLGSGLEKVLIILGRYREEILFAFPPNKKVTFIDNPHYRQGMFSSVQAGVAALPPDCRAFLLMPADHPLVRPQTIRRLLEAYAAGDHEIVYPVFSGRRGHPCLISIRYRDEILKGGFTEGMRTLLAAHEDAAVEVEVEDEGILLDLDTPADYQRIRARLDGSPRNEDSPEEET